MVFVVLVLVVIVGVDDCDCCDCLVITGLLPLLSPLLLLLLLLVVVVVVVAAAIAAVFVPLLASCRTLDALIARGKEIRRRGQTMLLGKQKIDTVDGRKFAPVDIVNIPLFRYRVLVRWCRISSIGSINGYRSRIKMDLPITNFVVLLKFNPKV